MSQKEIIYLSFGSFSNHLSTHFWNQQQSYFSYEPDLASGSTSHDPSADEPLIDHDVSFQAGQSSSGQDTYSPRTILFETEQEFGALSKLNALYRSFPDEDVALDSLSSWGMEAEVIAAERIRTSRYQQRLELEDQGIDPGSEDEDEDEDHHVHESADRTDLDQPSSPQRQRARKRGQRFWSDYSRTFFHPKSLVSVGGELMAPMPGSYNAPSSEGSDGRIRFETFSQGAKYFSELEAQKEVLDTNIRWFAEDADLLQGFQYSVDTSDAFGGLGSRYLENLVDEFPKVSHMVFGAAWGKTAAMREEEGGDAAWVNRLARVRRMNNLQSLVQLMEFSTIVVPLSVPSDGESQVGANWRRYLGRIEMEDMHHAAALMSAHLETATLGTRLKSRSETLSSLTSRLNWRKDTKLVHLGGSLPLAYPTPLVASSSSQRSSSSMDPVDALLQSYGYGADRDARLRQRGAPLESEAERAARGAQLALSTWLDFSLPSTLPGGEKHRKKLLYNLSRPFSHTATLRNSDLNDARLGLGMLDTLLSHIREPFGQGIFIPQSYNVLSSFPNFFTRLDSFSRAITDSNDDQGGKNKASRPKVVPVLSSLSATPSSVYRLKEARETVSEVLRGHLPLVAYGLDGEDTRDMLKEVREQVEGWIDAYNVDNGGTASEEDAEEMGTDEEYQVDQNQQDGLDWDI